MTNKVKFSPKHLICITLTILFVLCSVFVFPDSLSNLLGAFRDLGVSAYNYGAILNGFFKMFKGFNPIESTINVVPDKSIQVPFIGSLDKFQSNLSAYWSRFFSKANYNGYKLLFGDLLYSFAMVLLPLLLIFLMLLVIFRLHFKQENNDYNKDSFFLTLHKKITQRAYFLVKEYIYSFTEFFIDYPIYLWIWIAVWAYNFNLIKILISFIAFILHFAVSFDVSGIFIQIYKLLFDLSPALAFIPDWLLVILAYFVFDLIRKANAYSRILRYEKRNRGFINSLPLAVLIESTMGSGKTTMLMDMSITQEAMFRDKLKDTMQEIVTKFKHFPWITFENEIKEASRKHRIYNFATCELFITQKADMFYTDKSIENCFGYDYGKYGLTYDDKLMTISLFDVLDTYAKAYYAYTVDGSLIYSNFSIRVNNELEDNGNFPLWKEGFFRKKYAAFEIENRHSRILDFDLLRLKKTVGQTDNCFEFGVLAITEIGKERGNQLSNKGIGRTDPEANRLNDGFDIMIKLLRHPSTIDNYPLVRFFTDDQRAKSLLADNRDLCDIINIDRTSELKLAMPFTLGELFHDFVFSTFKKLYTQYRFNRGDNTLLMHLITSFASFVHNRYKRLYNLYSYKIQYIDVGQEREDKKECKYYLIPRKDYSNRFATDAWAAFFRQKALKAKYGINDVPEYKKTKASLDELRLSKSYIVDEIDSAVSFEQPSDDWEFEDND